MLIPPWVGLSTTDFGIETLAPLGGMPISIDIWTFQTISLHHQRFPPGNQQKGCERLAYDFDNGYDGIIQ